MRYEIIHIQGVPAPETGVGWKGFESYQEAFGFIGYCFSHIQDVKIEVTRLKSGFLPSRWLVKTKWASEIAEFIIMQVED